MYWLPCLPWALNLFLIWLTPLKPVALSAGTSTRPSTLACSRASSAVRLGFPGSAAAAASAAACSAPMWRA
eukprot:6875682-Prymnesium_polylepis.1